MSTDFSIDNVSPEQAARNAESRREEAARTAAVTRKEVADRLPQAVITATVEEGGDYTLTALLADDLEVTATYPGWHLGASRRADGRAFIRRVIKQHQKEGVPVAYLKRRTKTALWVRVDLPAGTAEPAILGALDRAKDYVLRIGLATRTDYIGSEHVATGSYVFKYVIR